jgi:hypothetical protein
MMSMEGPLGALSTGLTVSTTEVEDIVNGGPPGRRCRWVWQRPPPSLKTSSMAVPLGLYRWVQQRPPPSLKMTSMVGLLGGTGGRSDSVPHLG